MYFKTAFLLVFGFTANLFGTQWLTKANLTDAIKKVAKEFVDEADLVLTCIITGRDDGGLDETNLMVSVVNNGHYLGSVLIHAVKDCEKVRKELPKKFTGAKQIDLCARPIAKGRGLTFVLLSSRSAPAVLGHESGCLKGDERYE